MSFFVSDTVEMLWYSGVSFDDENTIISLMFLQWETPDPSDICLGNRND